RVACAPSAAANADPAPSARTTRGSSPRTASDPTLRARYPMPGRARGLLDGLVSPRGGGRSGRARASGLGFAFVAGKRAGAAVVAVAALAGCGGKARPPTMRFHSRPDLIPPVMTIVKATGAAAEGYIFIAPKREAPQKGPESLDRNGQAVWFHPVAG